MSSEPPKSEHNIVTVAEGVDTPTEMDQTGVPREASDATPVANESDSVYLPVVENNIRNTSPQTQTEATQKLTRDDNTTSAHNELTGFPDDNSPETKLQLSSINIQVCYEEHKPCPADLAGTEEIGFSSFEEQHLQIAPVAGVNTRALRLRPPSPSFSAASAFSATTSTGTFVPMTAEASLPPSPTPTPEPCIAPCPSVAACAPGTLTEYTPAAYSSAVSVHSAPASVMTETQSNSSGQGSQHAASIAERQRATRIQSSVARTTMLLYSARLMANAKFLYIIMFIIAFPQLVVGTAILAYHGTLQTHTDCHYILTMWGIVYLCRLAFVLIVRSTIIALVAKGKMTSDEANNSPKLRWVYYLTWGFGVVWTLAGTANIATVSETCYELGHYQGDVWINATESTEVVHHTVVAFLVFAWIDVAFPFVLGCILVPMIIFFTMTWLSVFSSWHTRQSTTQADKVRAKIDSLPLVVYTKVESNPERSTETKSSASAPNNGTSGTLESIELTSVTVQDPSNSGQKVNNNSTSEPVPTRKAPDEPKDECAICIVEFDSGHVCRVLPCGHLFHRDCIDQWLLINSVCCLCRRRAFEITSDEEGSQRESAPAPQRRPRKRVRRVTRRQQPLTASQAAAASQPAPSRKTSQPQEQKQSNTNSNN